MSWISDVKYELSELDISRKSLRKFGLMIGTILVLISILMLSNTSYRVFNLLLFSVGIFLAVFGIFKPSILELIYKVWMGLAFAIGWIISRVILSLLFYFVITPIGYFSKLFGKSFLDIRYKTTKKSSWIKKNTSKSKIEKMY